MVSSSCNPHVHESKMARGHSYVNKQKGRAKESGYRASVVAWLRALPQGMHFSKTLCILWLDRVNIAGH